MVILTRENEARSQEPGAGSWDPGTGDLSSFLLFPVFCPFYLPAPFLRLLLFCFGIPLRYIAPVDDAPDCFNVIGADVLILEVIGMFPDVDA